MAGGRRACISQRRIFSRLWRTKAQALVEPLEDVHAAHVNLDLSRHELQARFKGVQLVCKLVLDVPLKTDRRLYRLRGILDVLCFVRRPNIRPMRPFVVQLERPVGVLVEEPLGVWVVNVGLRVSWASDRAAMCSVSLSWGLEKYSSV